MKELTEAQQKAKALLYEPAYASDKDAAVKQAAAAFSEGYKDFLTRCKTEREVAAYAEEALKAAGYQLYDDRKQYAPGEKVYWIHEGKVVLCGTIGTRSMEDGFHLVIAHIDAPRLDIRPNPLYEAAPCMRRPISACSRPTTTAASASTSGPPCPWLSTASSPVPTAAPSPSRWARTRATPPSASPTCCPT